MLPENEAFNRRIQGSCYYTVEQLMGSLNSHEQRRFRHADQSQRSFKKGNSREEQKMTIKEDKRKLILARRKMTKLRKILPPTPNLLAKFVRHIMQLQSIGSVECPF